ncbi:hypothetical protein [Shewanella sp. OMA3-2]|uniref:hypothetical protein n=1 Tax=Shewanella sp. OMA3-2 TaxID=2908650 RepID=UPI001F2F8B1C|nr:hypothetical protein [Shewanella sp. OMA3-2]UJF20541.1 hypothetical protein L0B17_09970 [Shewanella sp. OMA3-2]
MEFTTWLAILIAGSFMAIYSDHRSNPKTITKHSSSTPNYQLVNPFIAFPLFSVYFFDLPHWDKALILARVSIGTILLNFLVDKFYQKDNQWIYQLNIFAGPAIINTLIIFFRSDNAETVAAATSRSAETLIEPISIEPTLSSLYAALVYFALFVAQMINSRIKTETQGVIGLLLISANFVVPHFTSSFWWMLPISFIISIVTAKAVADAACNGDKTAAGGIGFVYSYAVMMMLSLTVIIHFIATVIDYLIS